MNKTQLLGSRPPIDQSVGDDRFRVERPAATIGHADSATHDYTCRRRHSGSFTASIDCNTFVAITLSAAMSGVLRLLNSHQSRLTTDAAA